MQSSEAEAKRKAHNEKMKHYMRAWRARRKLAKGAFIAIDETRGEDAHTYEATNDSGMGGAKNDD